MQTARRPSTGWIKAVLWLSVAGLVGAIVWGFFSYQSLQDRLAAMPRTAVPGQVAIQVQDPGTLTIFYEDPTAGGTFVVQSNATSTLTPSPVQLAVTGPSGESVPTSPYQRDLRFDYDGRIVTALATIDPSASGTYTIDVSGTVPSTARISVGDVVDFGLIASAAGAIVLFLGSLLALLVTVVMTAVRRSRV
ncbi:MAG: hypothetical protein WB239_11855, partial [Acidimicrobiia bacterium]